MKINLKPDNDMSTQKQKIGRVPTLILKPKAIEPATVGLLWIHGGGYITGMKELVYMSRAADILKRYGVTVFSPGYRLAWLHPYPAAVNDCFEVLEYMDKHRAELGFDRIMVGGESAGGGMCAALCMLAKDRGEVSIAFQMPVYPMLDDRDTASSADNHAPNWNTKRNHKAWKRYLREAYGTDIVSCYAAPARREDFSGLPPCYTYVGDIEPFYQETLDYVRRLKEAGVEASVDVYPGWFHAYDLFFPAKKVVRDAIAAFERHFAYASENYFAPQPDPMPNSDQR